MLSRQNPSNMSASRDKGRGMSFLATSRPGLGVLPFEYAENEDMHRFTAGGDETRDASGQNET